ncbi:MAG TPA: O-antigen ligase family protein [Actinomycetota bacterium]
MALGNRKDAAILLPGAAGAVGLGVLTADLPIVGGGLFGFGLLLVLPWVALFFLLNLFSMIQSVGYGPLSGIQVGGFRVSPAHLILIPLLIRVYLNTRQGVRSKWGGAEWFLIVYAIIQPVITLHHAPNPKASLGALGLVALGVLVYLTVYAGVCTPRRVLAAVKIFLWLILFNASFGLLALMAHLAIGTHIGVSQRSAYGSGVFGLSFEHDIFASTCAVGAIAFYVLWRERNTLFSSRFSGIATCICGVAMLTGLARGAWVGFGLAFIALMLFPRARTRRVRGVERAGFLLILVSLLLLGGAYAVTTSASVGSAFSAVQQKAVNLVNVTSGSGRSRIGETQQALTDWKTSKLFGLGTGSYNQRHPLPNSTNYIGDIYLRALYETGLFGLLLYLGFFALLFWPNRWLLFSTNELAPLARAMTFGGAVILIAYAATDATLQVWPWVLFGLIRATRFVAERQAREELDAARMVEPVPALVSPAVGIGNGWAAPRREVHPRI